MAVSVQCIKAVFRKIDVFAWSGRICLRWAYLLKEAYLLEVGAGLPFPLCFPNKPSRNSRANKYFASILARVNNRFYDKIDFFRSWYMFGDIYGFNCFTRNSDWISFTFIFIDQTSFLTTVHVQQLKSLKDDGSTMHENWRTNFEITNKLWNSLSL